MSAPAFDRDQVRTLSRLGQLDNEDLERTLSRLKTLEPSARATLLRLALRQVSAGEGYELVRSLIKKHLSETYQAASRYASGVEKLAYDRWSQGYAGEQAREQPGSAIPNASAATYLDELVSAGTPAAGWEIDLPEVEAVGKTIHLGRIQNRLTNEVVALNVLRQLKWYDVTQNEIESRTEHFLAYGLCDSGPKQVNDDVMAIARYVDGSILVALADGSGDADDGRAAAHGALVALVKAMCFTNSVLTAVRIVNSEVVSANLRSMAANYTTLVAVFIPPDGAATGVSVGDSVVGWQQGNGDWAALTPNFSTRSIIGGEPLGITISSSGRSIQHCHELEGVQSIVLPSGVNQIFLSSDGVIPLSSAAAISASLNSAQRAPSKLPRENVQHFVHLTREAYAAGAKPDNFTCIFAQWSAR
jgi:hypothetical protein